MFVSLFVLLPVEIYLLRLKNPKCHRIKESKARNRRPANTANNKIHNGTPKPPIPPKSPEVFKATTLDVTVNVLRPR